MIHNVMKMWHPTRVNSKKDVPGFLKKIFISLLHLWHKLCMFYTQSTTSLLLALHAATLGPKSLRNLLEDYQACQNLWSDVLFNLPGVDKGPSPWSPSPTQSVAEPCPSAACKL